MAQPMAATQPTTPDPFAAMGGGVWTGTNWVTKDHPMAAGFAGTGAQTPGSTKLDIPVPDAPAFPGSTLPMPTLGTVDPYTGPKAFEVPGADGLYADPGYQFRLDQGRKALERSAAARGMLSSGAQAQALIDYGQGAASQEYGNVWNRAKDKFVLDSGAAGDAYDRSRLERDARLSADVGNYGRGFDERKAAYQPAYDTWAARAAAAQRNGELNFNREWDAYTFDKNLAQRDKEFSADDSYRRSAYAGDDAWRRFQLEEQRRQFLATLGAQ